MQIIDLWTISIGRSLKFGFCLEEPAHYYVVIFTADARVHLSKVISLTSASIFLKLFLSFRHYCQKYTPQIFFLRTQSKDHWGDNNSMEIFDSKKTVIEARDNNIHLNFWKIAKFNLIQIICIKERLLIIKVNVFLSLFFRIVLQYSRTWWWNLVEVLLAINPNTLWLSSWEIKEYLCISNLFWLTLSVSIDFVLKSKEKSFYPILSLRPLMLKANFYLRVIPSYVVVPSITKIFCLGVFILL